MTPTISPALAVLALSSGVLIFVNGLAPNPSSLGLSALVSDGEPLLPLVEEEDEDEGAPLILSSVELLVLLLLLNGPCALSSNKGVSN